MIISIHALLAESDGTGGVDANAWWEFLSTLSLRRATLLYAMGYYRHGNFYPRSPCGERLCFAGAASAPDKFLSTLSLRRATNAANKAANTANISIHALLAESDCQVKKYSGLNFAHFYPRSPCGERPVKLFRQNYECFISIHALLAESDLPSSQRLSTSCLFLSTLSLRRATALGLPGWLRTLISIHALLAESDTSSTVIVILSKNFYPRSPCGERHARRALGFVDPDISIHALLAESDASQTNLPGKN